MAEIKKVTKQIVNANGQIIRRDACVTIRNGKEVEVNELGYTWNEVWSQIHKEYTLAVQKITKDKELHLNERMSS